MGIFIGYSDTGKYILKRVDFIKKISIKNVFIYSQNRLFLIWDNMYENQIIFFCYFYLKFISFFCKLFN